MLNSRVILYALLRTIHILLARVVEGKEDQLLDAITTKRSIMRQSSRKTIISLRIQNSRETRGIFFERHMHNARARRLMVVLA